MSAPTHELPPSATNQPGFYLWVGLAGNENELPGAKRVKSADIIEIAEALGELARELLPNSQTHTTLALGEPEPSTRPVQAGSTRGHGAQRYQAPRTARRSSQPIRPQQRQARPTYDYSTDADYLNEPVDFTRNASLPDFDRALAPRVVIDLHNRRVIADSELQRLTYKEFELLAYLVNSASRIISREELFNSIWRTGVQTDSRTIDVHIRRLREKLGLEHHIITVRGSGYKFELTEQIDVIPPAPRPLHR